jgi:4'-phosphopantetheinyl transferase
MTTPDDEVQVWCVRLTAERNLVARAYSLLSTQERARADRLRFQDSRDEFIMCRASLRVLLARVRRAAPTELEFVYGRHGKPALASQGGAHLDFNVSHSRGVLACAFVRDCPIGIDVEYQGRIADCEAIARRFFSASELADLLSVPVSKRPVAFYDCWVRKEAFVKGLGGGLAIPLDAFSITLTPGCLSASVHVRDSPEEERAWSVYPFVPAARFSGAVAVRHPERRLRIHAVEASSIFTDAHDLSLSLGDLREK